MVFIAGTPVVLLYCTAAAYSLHDLAKSPRRLPLYMRAAPLTECLLGWKAPVEKRRRAIGSLHMLHIVEKEVGSFYSQAFPKANLFAQASVNISGGPKGHESLTRTP